MKTIERTEKTKAGTILITERNKRKLEEMIEKIEARGGKEENLESLRKELNRARVVGSDTVPRNCVTMGSTVSVINLETSERLKFELVYPGEADFENGKISILSPVGVSVLGYCTGDEFDWDMPSGRSLFVIAKVDAQPEAESIYTI